MGETVAGILAGAAIIAALVVIGRSVAWLTGVLRKLSHLVDDLTGEPARPGFQGRPGLLVRVTSIEAGQEAIEAGQISSGERLTAVEKRLAAVEAQLRPNGGGTFRDAVDQAIKPPSEAAA
jgi:hypothetical protein